MARELGMEVWVVDKDEKAFEPDFGPVLFIALPTGTVAFQLDAQNRAWLDKFPRKPDSNGVMARNREEKHIRMRKYCDA